MTTKILFVGDIHGEFRRFSDLINLQEPDITIQLGDNAYFWLTKNGWVKSSNISKSDEIAQFNKETGEISFTFPKRLECHYEKQLVEIESSKIKQRITFNHHLVINNKFEYAKDILDKDIFQNDFRLYGSLNNIDYDISDDMLRLLVWVICDSTIVKTSENKKRIQFKLSKERKIKTLIQILEKLNIEYTFRKATKSISNILQPYYIRIYGEHARNIFNILNEKKQFPGWIKNISERQLQIVLNELLITDGSRNGDTLTFSTTNKYDADIIHELCIMNKRVCHIVEQQPNKKSFGKKIFYRLHIYLKERKPINNLKIKSKVIEYNDYVYCVTMPLGTIITRLNGKSNFTGNCWDTFEDVIGRRGLVPIEVEQNLFLCPIGSSINLDGYKFLFLGGADSIDKDRRIIGHSWFRQELFNEGDYEFVSKNIKEADIICSHTSPKAFDEGIIKYLPIYEKLKDPSREWLNYILHDLKPKAWFFGHWHQHMTGEYNGTQWECLDHIRSYTPFFNVFEIS
jgi:Icc-related predicted phosphoesterase